MLLRQFSYDVSRMPRARLVSSHSSWQRDVSLLVHFEDASFVTAIARPCGLVEFLRPQIYSVSNLFPALQPLSYLSLVCS
jgi:hypothetical protein